MDISLFKSFKTDERPKKHGWAPGNYTCKCSECQVDFVGDKRASMCADCAYSPEIEARQAKRDKEKLKQRIIELHLANPTLSNDKLGEHFGVSGATAAKYIKEYNKIIKPRRDFYDNLMVLAKEIKATDLNVFYQFILSCIDGQKNNCFEAYYVAYFLQLPKADVEKMFAQCVKHKVFVKRLECNCGQLVQGDYPQCPTCKISTFKTVFEAAPKLSNTRVFASKEKNTI